MTDADGSDRPDLGVETLRIVSAVQDWMRSAVPSADAGARPASGPAPHGSDCEWCPVCQLAAALRAEHPELVDRVGEAVAAVSGALRAVASAALAHVPPSGEAAADVERPRPRPRVERIDLDDE